MRPFFTFTIAALILTACATSPTPAPTADMIPSATATILPPTKTPIPTAIVSVTVEGEPYSLLILMTTSETYQLLLDNIHTYLPGTETVTRQAVTFFNFAYETENKGVKSIQSAYEMARINVAGKEQLAFLTSIDGETKTAIYSWGFSRTTEEGIEEVFYIDSKTGDEVVVMRTIPDKPDFMEFYLADNDDLSQRTMLLAKMTLAAAEGSGKMAAFINKSFLPELVMGANGPELTVNGMNYVLDTARGRWVEADIATAVALFDMLGVSDTTYELKRVDGSLVGVDKVSGEEIFRDGNFDLRYAVEAVAASGKLEPTTHKPRPESEVGTVNSPPLDLRTKYMGDVIKLFKAYYNATPEGIAKPMGPGTSEGISLLLNPGTLSWGYVAKMYSSDPDSQELLFYRQSDGKLVVIPLEQGSLDQVSGFWR